MIKNENMRLSKKSVEEKLNRCWIEGTNMMIEELKNQRDQTKKWNLELDDCVKILHELQNGLGLILGFKSKGWGVTAAYIGYCDKYRTINLVGNFTFHMHKYAIVSLVLIDGDFCQTSIPYLNCSKSKHLHFPIHNEQSLGVNELKRMICILEMHHECMEIQQTCHLEYLHEDYGSQRGNWANHLFKDQPQQFFDAVKARYSWAIPHHLQSLKQGFVMKVEEMTKILFAERYTQATVLRDNFGKLRSQNDIEGYCEQQKENQKQWPRIKPDLSFKQAEVVLDAIKTELGIKKSQSNECLQCSLSPFVTHCKHEILARSSDDVDKTMYKVAKSCSKHIFHFRVQIDRLCNVQIFGAPGQDGTWEFNRDWKWDKSNIVVSYQNTQFWKVKQIDSNNISSKWLELNLDNGKLQSDRWQENAIVTLSLKPFLLEQVNEQKSETQIRFDDFYLQQTAVFDPSSQIPQKQTNSSNPSNIQPIFMENWQADYTVTPLSIFQQDQIENSDQDAQSIDGSQCYEYYNYTETIQEELESSQVKFILSQQELIDALSQSDLINKNLAQDMPLNDEQKDGEDQLQHPLATQIENLYKQFLALEPTQEQQQELHDDWLCIVQSKYSAEGKGKGGARKRVEKAEEKRQVKSRRQVVVEGISFERCLYQREAGLVYEQLLLEESRKYCLPCYLNNSVQSCKPSHQTALQRAYASNFFTNLLKDKNKHAKLRKTLGRIKKGILYQMLIKCDSKKYIAEAAKQSQCGDWLAIFADLLTNPHSVNKQAWIDKEVKALKADFKEHGKAEKRDLLRVYRHMMTIGQHEQHTNILADLDLFCSIAAAHRTYGLEAGSWFKEDEKSRTQLDVERITSQIDKSVVTTNEKALFEKRARGQNKPENQRV